MKRIAASLPSLLGLVFIFLWVGTWGCASKHSREAEAKRIADQAITVKVKSALLADKEVGRLSITVKCHKGDVQLTGTARSDWQKIRATVIAEAVPGIKSVRNSIEVKTAPLPQWGSPK